MYFSFKKSVCLITILLCSSQMVWADCPSISSVKFKCTNDGKHCNWTAPWYEGFPDSDASVDMIPEKFVKVFWGTKRPPETNGSTVCFYQNPKSGRLIELVQNRWGDVPEPQDAVWGPGEYDGYQGKQCPKIIDNIPKDPADCHFSYP